MLSSFGDGDDVSVIHAINRAVRWFAGREERIDIVVMSFGAYGVDDKPPPMVATIARRLSDSLVVAAAGNNSSPRPFYPAALPEVVAVGALDAGGRAWFSNFGPWVDACAPGVDVLSTYPAVSTQFSDDFESDPGTRWVLNGCTRSTQWSSGTSPRR